MKTKIIIILAFIMSVVFYQNFAGDKTIKQDGDGQSNNQSAIFEPDGEDITGETSVENDGAQLLSDIENNKKSYSNFYSKGPGNIKKISLTFDDGPGRSTDFVLKLLKEKNVKATFFLLGTQVEKNPKLAKRILEEGHEIGNHTYSHLNFYSYSESSRAEVIERELMKSGKILSRVLGINPRLVRYPNGYSKPDALEIAERYGYKVINWSFGEDWKRKIKNGQMYSQYLRAVSNGAILLFHDTHKNSKSLSFLPKLIDEIKKRKYEIATVSELLSLDDK
ncbi:MAG: polysaccharide deacetylase family protein [Elusimicrobiota bacterium]|jgi:peptidoglycan/xylan/chitin deacetylase (PgdA/CDA1 family)|nr:polysaccharide deacetylase family protein [Elusimicrobiota bacterium]